MPGMMNILIKSLGLSVKTSQLKKLDYKAEPQVLAPWDPMGALASK